MPESVTSTRLFLVALCDRDFYPWLPFQVSPTASPRVRISRNTHTPSGSWIIGVITAVLTVAGCASSPPKGSPAVAAADYSATRDRVGSTSLKYVGTPYERGGTSPAGFDCSGFVLFVYAQAGVALPPGVAKQYRLGS